MAGHDRRQAPGQIDSIHVQPGVPATVIAPLRLRLALRRQDRRVRLMRKAMAGRLSEGVAAALFGIALDDIRATTRSRRRIAEARQIGMYLLHQVFDEPLSRTGRAFGRDRTTARHAVLAILRSGEATGKRQHHGARIAAVPIAPALALWADRFATLIAGEDDGA